MSLRWLTGQDLAELKSKNAVLEAEVRLLRMQRDRLHNEIHQLHMDARVRARAVTNAERASAFSTSDYLVAGCDQGRRVTASHPAFSAPYGSPYRVEQSGHPVHWRIRDTRTGFVHFRTHSSQAAAARCASDWYSNDRQCIEHALTRIGSTGTFTSNQQFWKGAQL